MTPESKKTPRWLQWIGPAAAIVLFGAAAWIIGQEFRRYTLVQVISQLRGYDSKVLALSVLLTAFNYLTLTGYDQLAFKYVGQRIPIRRVTFAAFVAYAFENNFGMANFAGAAGRYRIYSAWKIPPKVITKVIALDVLSNWLGFLTICGCVLTFNPPPIPALEGVPLHNARPLGIGFLVALAAYLLLGWLRKKPFRIWKWEIPVPDNWIFLAQVAIACFDFALGGIVLYVLLPSHPSTSYWDFLSVYMLSKTISIASHVPGGLGIFESLILLSFHDRYPGSAILGALFAYRVIYYLCPLILASFGYFSFEARRQIHREAHKSH